MKTYDNLTVSIITYWSALQKALGLSDDKLFGFLYDAELEYSVTPQLQNEVKVRFQPSNPGYDRGHLEVHCLFRVSREYGGRKWWTPCEQGEILGAVKGAFIVWNYGNEFQKFEITFKEDNLICQECENSVDPNESIFCSDCATPYETEVTK